MESLQERFEAFERTPPPDLFGDPIWRLPAYRIALFLSDVSQRDAHTLAKTTCSPHVVDQLVRSVDSIRANISEGYSRLSGRERARYFEIALGSAREARDWYRRAIPWLGELDSFERAALLTRIIKILLVAVPQERNGATEFRLQSGRKRKDELCSSPSTQHTHQQEAVSTQLILHPLLRVRPFTNRSMRSTPRSLASDAGFVPAIRCEVVDRCDDEAYSRTRATSDTS